MANGRNKVNKGSSGRIQEAFVAMPWSVLDSMAYASLSLAAKALLMELARQYVRDNNGRLLLSFAYLSKRGWNSKDVITRAKRELLTAGFIHETVVGHRPNKASWYAVTWWTLDKIKGYDFGVEATFRRSAFRDSTPLKPKLTREQIYKKHESAGKKTAHNNTSLSPSDGLESLAIGPSDGTEVDAAGPSGGTVSAIFHAPSSPSDGNHLDMPSPTAVPSAATSDPAPQISANAEVACGRESALGVNQCGHASMRAVQPQPKLVLLQNRSVNDWATSELTQEGAAYAR